MKRVALLGLSANPPSGLGGHQGIVRGLVGSDQFDEVWIMPVHRHMFSAKDTQLLPFEQRMEMCRLCFQGESNGHCMVKVVPLEQEAAEFFGADYRVGTIDIIDFIKQRHPDHQITLVLGLDTFSDLACGKWKQSDRYASSLPFACTCSLLRCARLLSSVNFIVLDRDGVVLDAAKQASVDRLLASQSSSIRKLPLTDVSSTQLRDILAAEGPQHMEGLGADVIHPAVRNYIVSNGLFAREREDV